MNHNYQKFSEALTESWSRWKFQESCPSLSQPENWNTETRVLFVTWKVHCPSTVRGSWEHLHMTPPQKTWSAEPSHTTDLTRLCWDKPPIYLNPPSTGMQFVEAFRQLQFRSGSENFCLVHVSLVVETNGGEHKTKPTQQVCVCVRGSFIPLHFILICRFIP